MITFEEFQKVDIRVGTIISAEENPNVTKPSLILIVDFGSELGLKKTSAQLTENYITNQLIGLQIAAVINFSPKQIGKMISEFLVLGFPDINNQPILFTPTQKIENGGKLF
jgi:tRNA-binding protein